MMVPDIIPRHSLNHTRNIKYGYIIFGVSVAYALFFAAVRSLETRQWTRNGKPTRSGWARVAHLPLWLHMGLWVAIVTGLTFSHVSPLSETVSVVIKRLGRLAFCLVPLDIVLALRPSVLGASYVELLGLHKWLLRLIVVVGIVHGIAFLVKWTVDGTLGKVTKWANFAGVVVALALAVLGVVSLRPLRRRFYAYFYLWHNISVALFVALMYWHARPAVEDFIAVVVLLVGVQTVLRVYFSYSVPSLTIVDKDLATLRLLRLEKPMLYSLWTPGSHLRLGPALTNWRSWVFPAHPYTICLAPELPTVDLVVKKGFRFEVMLSLQYRVSAPFASVPQPWFATANNVHVICGGSGISLGIPILRYFGDKSTALASLHWCVSNVNDTFVLSELALADQVEVYVTGNVSTEFSDETDDPSAGLLEENIELESLDPFADPHELPRVHRGRPEFGEIFASFAETADVANKLLVACGPTSLVQEANAWGDAHGIAVFSEIYSF